LNSILKKTKDMAHQKPPQPVGSPTAPDPLRVDPGDARLYARRIKEAKRVGPLAKFFRYAAILLLLAGALAAVWNYETLLQLRLDFSELTGLFKDDARRNADGTPVPDGELATEVVEAGGVAGVGLPSSIDGEPTEAEPPASSPRAVDTPPARETVAATSPAPAPAATPQERVEPERPPPPPVEEPPAGPEVFGFGLITRMSVSEADAVAAVLVLREGGRRGVSSVIWWTTDGTAKAGSDYADLGRRVERFSVGEQNRTLRVPIIGDRNVEGPETFFLHVAPGDDTISRPESVAQIEVAIDDDD
jgi:hypothetical protein